MYTRLETPGHIYPTGDARLFIPDWKCQKLMKFILNNENTLSCIPDWRCADVVSGITEPPGPDLILQLNDTPDQII